MGRCLVDKAKIIYNMANKCDYNFIRICSENFDLKDPIYEFGAYQIRGQEGFSDCRTFFPGKKYIGTDTNMGPGVDEIRDISRSGFESESIDTIISTNTIEHLEYPREAVQEMFRILKKDGTFIITSVMDHTIHNWPNDYWRFTPECLKSLLKDFKTSFVEFSGDPLLPKIVAGIGWKQEIKIPNKFLSDIQQWKKDFRYLPMSFGLHVKRFIPPIITDFYDKNLYKPLWRIRRKVLNKVRIG